MQQEKRFKEATWYPQFLEAKPLELFVNLEESETAFSAAHPKFKNEKKQPVTAAEFREKYPNFAPDSWWDYRSDAEDVVGRFDTDFARFGGEIVREKWEPTQWQTAQKLLRSAWDGGFPLEARDLIILLTIVFDPQELNEGDRPLLGNILQIDPQNAYYKSLVWLNSQPWRARVCKTCGRRFIASWPSNECCSQPCIPTSQPSYKRDYRNARRDKYNTARRKARARKARKIPSHRIKNA